jgi:hypothetical protein
MTPKQAKFIAALCDRSVMADESRNLMFYADGEYRELTVTPGEHRRIMGIANAKGTSIPQLLAESFKATKQKKGANAR